MGKEAELPMDQDDMPGHFPCQATSWRCGLSLTPAESLI